MTIYVPATSANLGAGFDSLGVALKFYNRVEIAPSRIFSLSIRGEGEKMLKARGNNVFIDIFNSVYERLTGEIGVFRFHFFNQIPLSRGMGSSSAVIVSAIYSAYAAAKCAIDKHEILNEAVLYERHPDNITPATFGGFCVAALEGGKVRHICTQLDPDLRAVMVIPNKPLSTRQSRAVLRQKVKLEDAVFNLSRSSLLTAALMTKNYDLLRCASQDRFHQEVRMRLLPALFEVQKTALGSGALMSTLSGSGSSFFNLAQNGDQAQKIASDLAKRFGAFRVEILEFDTLGTHSKE
ncbi:homoserine kinase [Campylobacterota bacterium]|nr:homoserine kinase [Campylobacterota bacterium]